MREGKSEAEESSQSTPFLVTATEGSTARTTDAHPEPLTADQLQAGISEATRIINNSAGYYFGGEITEFAPEFKRLALRAIAQLQADPFPLVTAMERELDAGGDSHSETSNVR